MNTSTPIPSTQTDPAAEPTATYGACLENSFVHRYRDRTDVWTDEWEMRNFAAFVAASTPLPDFARVLDIGAGRGRDSQVFLEKSLHVTAVDICCPAELLELGRRFGPRLTLMKSRFLEADIPPGSCALAFDNGCFHHQHPAHLHPYLEKVFDSLSDVGILALNVFCFKSRPGHATHTMRDGRLIHVYDETSLGEALRQAGYTDIRTTRVKRQHSELDYDYLYVLAKKSSAPKR